MILSNPGEFKLALPSRWTRLVCLANLPFLAYSTFGGTCAPGTTSDLAVSANASDNQSSGAFVARIADSADCSFTLKPASLLAYSAGNTAFAVTAPGGCAWTANSDSSWITLSSGTSGTGSAVIAATLAANNTGSTRTGNVTVGGQSFRITQADAGCTYAVSTPASLPATGGQAQITVNASSGCPWNVTPASSLVSIVSGGSGAGNGTVTLSLPANNGAQPFSSTVQVGPACVTLQEADACTYSLSPLTLASTANASGSITVTASDPGCAWNPASDGGWLRVSGGGNGSGTLSYTVTANPGAVPRTAHITLDGRQFAITQSGPALRFVAVPPCRIADTRESSAPFTGQFGAPSLAGGTSRDFTIPASSCAIPATAQAYSLNVAVVPAGAPLGFLAMWPAGQPRPPVSVLNSLDGRIKSNTAIVPAGAGGAISVYVSDPSDVVLDIAGYFVRATDPTALAFYPVAPCRIADTRNPTGALGGPSLLGGHGRTFPILSAAACNVPATAQAYSLNLTAVPPGPLGFITAWPTGQTMPGASSLNALTGTIVANGAIIPAGTGGAIDIFAINNTDLVIDINGYFAPMASGGLSLYNLTPCRVLDTRIPAGAQPFTGQMDASVSTGACSIPASAPAAVLSATVVPATGLGYLTLWPQGRSQPTVSTLNALDAAITSNLAIVPTNNGSISAFASDPTQLIFDISGYFAQ
jgi:hypothetical protein